MKPTIEELRSEMMKRGGNISSVAQSFGVSRVSVYGWIKEDAEFESALKDSRGKMLDECISAARVLAVGVPDIDETGKMVGWRYAPDGEFAPIWDSSFAGAIVIDDPKEIEIYQAQQEAVKSLGRLLSLVNTDFKLNWPIFFSVAEGEVSAGNINYSRAKLGNSFSDYRAKDIRR